jgi:purine-nucleoside phosphorylase
MQTAREALVLKVSDMLQYKENFHDQARGIYREKMIRINK